MHFCLSLSLPSLLQSPLQWLTFSLPFLEQQVFSVLPATVGSMYYTEKSTARRWPILGAMLTLMLQSRGYFLVLDCLVVASSVAAWRWQFIRDIWHLYLRPYNRSVIHDAVASFIDTAASFVSKGAWQHGIDIMYTLRTVDAVINQLKMKYHINTLYASFKWKSFHRRRDYNCFIDGTARMVA